MIATKPRVTAIVLAYGDEPYLERCVQALIDSEGVEVGVIIWDNGADPQRVRAASSRPGVVLARSEGNLGFAGGCNAAAREAPGDVLVFVNSDAIVSPGCVNALVTALEEPDVGLATACVRLADSPSRVNSAGNPVHYLFFSWAGAFGEPASRHADRRPTASVSGATFAVRRTTWRSLGGFDDRFFAYGEDVDLSWRAWQAGYQVVFEPRAVSVHHYEFSRNPRKMYLLERNRLINLLTLPQRATVRRLVPIAILVEVGLLGAAARDGWASQKWEGWVWLARHRRYLRRRRARIDERRVVPDADLHPLLTPRLEPPPGLGQRVPAVVNWALSRYWQGLGRSSEPARVRRIGGDVELPPRPLSPRG